MNYSQRPGSTPRQSTLSASREREVVPLDEFERRYILGVLEATNYQIKGASGAATLLDYHLLPCITK